MREHLVKVPCAVAGELPPGRCAQGSREQEGCREASPSDMPSTPQPRPAYALSLKPTVRSTANGVIAGADPLRERLSFEG
jgi:hypothetical protein